MRIKPIVLAVLVLSFSVTSQDSGGEESFGVVSTPELSDEQRAAIIAEQRIVIDSLERAGVFARYVTSRKSLETKFAWPLEFDTGNGVFGRHVITNYYDHDTSSGLLDYNGGNWTYNGHKGTDFWLYPFPWYQMDSMRVRVVAAAPGVITGKREGNDDRSCAMVSGAQWNAVYIRHADGTIAWYGHFKKGTVTTKVVGDTVRTGEYLGIIGSSGSSTSPHLHLEIRDAANVSIDPFAGPYNPTTAVSWWQNQRPLADRAINRLMTGSSRYTSPACPGQEILNEKRAFQPGDSLYTQVFIRNPTSDRTLNCRIRQPDNTVWRSMTYTPTTAIAKTSYRYWSYVLPAGAMHGQWWFEADYDSATYRYAFTVGTVSVDRRDVANRGLSTQTSAGNVYDIRGRVVDSRSRLLNINGLFIRDSKPGDPRAGVRMLVPL